METLAQRQGKVKPRDFRSRRIVGIGALAKEAGVSVKSLYLVARGRMTSARLEAFLTERGVKVEKRRAR